MLYLVYGMMSDVPPFFDCLGGLWLWLWRWPLARLNKKISILENGTQILITSIVPAYYLFCALRLLQYFLSMLPPLCDFFFSPTFYLVWMAYRRRCCFLSSPSLTLPSSNCDFPLSLPQTIRLPLAKLRTYSYIHLWIFWGLQKIYWLQHYRRRFSQLARSNPVALWRWSQPLQTTNNLSTYCKTSNMLVLTLLNFSGPGKNLLALTLSSPLPQLDSP